MSELGTLTIRLVANDMETPLEGGIFTVAGQTLTTDENGIASIQLPVGEYEVEQTGAPDGYELDPTPQTVEITIEPIAPPYPEADCGDQYLELSIKNSNEKVYVPFNNVYYTREQVNALLDGQVLDFVYPIGAIYMSVNSTSPATLFGGTWERIQDTFLLAAGTTYNAGETGGEAEHTLTEEETPNQNWAVGFRTYGSEGTEFVRHSLTLDYERITGSSYMIPTNTTNTNKIDMLTYDFGNDEPHNNMPPYLAVYVWKRTA